MSLNAGEARSTLDVLTGERVHGLMWRKRIRNRDLVPVLGMTEVSVGRKIRGSRSWTLPELRTIADYLETSVAYLIGEIDDPDVGANELGRLASAAKEASASQTADNVRLKGLEPPTF